MTSVSSPKELPHYVGHRKRLKDKFLRGDPKHFSDYELLELLLFQAVPRRDVKPLAKRLIGQYKNFKNLVNAEQSQLLAVPEATESTYLQLRLLKELHNRIFNIEAFEENILSSWGAVLNYLKFNMGCLKIEQFRVLFLNKQNVLIADEVMATGTIDQTPVYPREIIKKSLFHEAGALILVHNHPSGKTTPSRSDIELTSQIVAACKSVNVTVHDHVIVGGNDYFSFKSNGLL